MPRNAVLLWKKTLTWVLLVRNWHLSIPFDVIGHASLPCRETHYGCCPDGETAASGPSGLGCPGIFHAPSFAHFHTLTVLVFSSPLNRCDFFIFILHSPFSWSVFLDLSKSLTTFLPEKCLLFDILRQNIPYLNVSFSFLPSVMKEEMLMVMTRGKSSIVMNF